MWRAITDFLLKINAQGLSHEAVIEVMIALLGVMIAVLTLISALFAAAVTVAGVFGFQTIRDEAKRRSERVARRVASRIAKDTATEIASKTREQIWGEVQASGMSEGQSEQDQGSRPIGASETTAPARKRRKATDDVGLKEGGTQ